ncbi:MAG: L,D-transpeptidase [Methylococcales bacterium]|nr:L,D-transpeptidase [Methylococcales bacterium]
MNAPDQYLHVSIANQQLSLIKNNALIQTYSISTAKNGVGEKMGSECTPRGWHKIRAKIGASQPLNSVFVGRRPTGEIYNPDLNQKYPQRDWILTRILWLGGLESGKNHYGQVDSTWRYIYIHGCPDNLIKGMPESHGCIRMKNQDIVDLFEKVDVGLKILIE